MAIAYYLQLLSESDPGISERDRKQPSAYLTPEEYRDVYTLINIIIDIN